MALPQNLGIPLTAVGGWFKSALLGRSPGFGWNPPHCSEWMVQVRPTNLDSLPRNVATNSASRPSQQ